MSSSWWNSAPFNLRWSVPDTVPWKTSSVIPTLDRTTTVIAVTAGSILVAGIVWKYYIRPKFFVRFFSTVISPKTDRRLEQRKRKLFAPMEEIKAARGDGRLVVLDVGSGTGVNFKFYPVGTEVICVDINPNFEKLLRAGCKDWPDVKVATYHVISAEKMHECVDEEVADAVVVSNMLCFSPDVDHVLQEVKRVLKPGGKVFFMEHVLSPPTYPYIRLIQRVFNPVWRFIMGGCNINRTTDKNIHRAGFSRVDLEYVEVFELTEPTPCFLGVRLLRSRIMGTATK